MTARASACRLMPVDAASLMRATSFWPFMKASFSDTFRESICGCECVHGRESGDGDGDGGGAG